MCVVLCPNQIQQTLPFTLSSGRNCRLASVNVHVSEGWEISIKYIVAHFLCWELLDNNVIMILPRKLNKKFLIRSGCQTSLSLLAIPSSPRNFSVGYWRRRVGRGLKSTTTTTRTTGSLYFQPCGPKKFFGSLWKDHPCFSAISLQMFNFCLLSWAVHKVYWTHKCLSLLKTIWYDLWPWSPNSLVWWFVVFIS